MKHFKQWIDHDHLPLMIASSESKCASAFAQYYCGSPVQNITIYSETHTAQINTTELINFVSSEEYKPDECKHMGNYTSTVKKLLRGQTYILKMHAKI